MEIFYGDGLKSQLVRGGIGSLIIKSLFTLLSFGIGVLLARFMGAADYGIYSMIIAIIMMLSVPAQFGLPILVVRETARSLAKSEWGKIRGIWVWSFRITIVLSVIIVAGAYLFMLIAADYIDPNYRMPLYWGLALLPLFVLSNQRSAALRGLQKVIQGQMPEQIIIPGFSLILISIMAFIIPQRMSPELAMTLRVFSTFIALVIATILLWVGTPEEIRNARAVHETKSWISSSFSFLLISGLEVINMWLGIIILGLFVPSVQIGIYRVSMQMAVLAGFGLQVVNPVIAPQIAHFYTIKDMKRLQRLTTRSAQFVLVLNILITGGFVFLGRKFIQVFFGLEFLPSYEVLLILLIGQLFNSLAGSVAYLLSMTGHEKIMLRVRVISTLVNIILVFTLSPVLGLYGAAIGTSISMVIWNVVLWRLVRKRLNINSWAFGRKVPL